MNKRRGLEWQEQAQAHYKKEFDRIVAQYDMLLRHPVKKPEGIERFCWYESPDGLIKLQFDFAIIFAIYITNVVMEGFDITKDPRLYCVVRIDESKDFSRGNLKVVLRSEANTLEAMNKMAVTKICIGCGITLATSEFDNDKANKNKSQNLCKLCEKIYRATQAAQALKGTDNEKKLL